MKSWRWATIKFVIVKGVLGMKYEKIVKTFQSNNFKNKITYYVYIPKTKPIAIVQISHGMCEYIERYEPFIEFLTEKSFIVCGNDHLGHGASVESKDGFGYFAESDGWKCLYEDVFKLTSIMKGEYPDLKYFLFGHSMGSFVLRAYLTKYANFLNGAIICGTSNGNPMLDMGIFLAKLIKTFKGEKYRSKLIKSMSFANYNSRYENKRTDYDWLTSDEKIVDAAIEDEKFMFTFTVSAYIDMFKLLKFISSRDWANMIDKNIPILLIAGDMDPVGEYGGGVKKVYEKLKNANIKDVNVKIYKNARHEILNEIIKEEVYDDILQWISNKVN